MSSAMVESDTQPEVQIIVMPTSYTFLAPQLKLLQDEAETVKSTENLKERHKLIKTIRKQVLALPDSKKLSLQAKTDLAIAVDTWFSLRSKKRGNKVKFAKTWTGRLVLYQENKERINKRKVELYEEARAEGKEPRNPFSYFQLAITLCWNEISRDERASYKALAKKWNEEGVSREQKQEAKADWIYRGAGKHTMAATKKFAEEMYRSFGIRYLFMVALETPTATIQTGVLDFNDCIAGGTSYTVTHQNWRTEGVDLDSWNQHNSDFYNAAKPQAEVETRKLPRIHLPLATNEYGEPVIPNPLLVPQRQLARTWRQSVVRAFLSKHYELASGSAKAIPWKKFLPKGRDCISTEYLPDAHLNHLAEPSSMRDNQCYSLLSFWYERQVAGVSPVFRFGKYFVQDTLVEARPRELVEAEGDDEMDDDGENVPRPRRRKGRRVGSAKGKEKAFSSEESSGSSDTSSFDDTITQPESHLTVADEADYVLDEMDPTPSSSTLTSLPLTISGPTLLSTGLHDSAQTSTDQPGTNQPPTSTHTAIPPLTVERPAPFTPERPATKELDDDSDFEDTPLDLNLLQPELQAIAKQLKTQSMQLKNQSPAVRKFLVTAFQALQLKTSTPSTSGPVADQAAPIPEMDNLSQTKRSRSDSVNAIPSSPTKKTRFLSPHSMPYKGDSKALDLTMEKELRNQAPIRRETQDLIGVTDAPNLAEGSSKAEKGKGSVKKNFATVVVPSSTQIPRRTRSQVLSNKMATRASTNRPK